MSRQIYFFRKRIDEQFILIGHKCVPSGKQWRPRRNDAFHQGLHCLLQVYKRDTRRKKFNLIWKLKAVTPLYILWTIPKLMHLIGRKNPLSAYMVKANRMPQKWKSLLTPSTCVHKNSFGSRSGLTFLANRPQHTLVLIWIQTVWYWRYSWFFVIFLKKVTLKKIRRRHFEKSYKFTQHVKIYFS